MSGQPSSLSYSPVDTAVIVYYVFQPVLSKCLQFQKGDGGHYELYQFAKDGRSSDSAECKRGTGACGAVFVGRKRFVVLEKGPKVSLYLSLCFTCLSSLLLEILTTLK